MPTKITVAKKMPNTIMPVISEDVLAPTWASPSKRAHSGRPRRKDRLHPLRRMDHVDRERPHEQAGPEQDADKGTHGPWPPETGGIRRTRLSRFGRRRRSASSPAAIRNAVRQSHRPGSRIATPRRNAWAKASDTASLATSGSPAYASTDRHMRSPWARYRRSGIWPCSTPAGANSTLPIQGPRPIER